MYEERLQVSLGEQEQLKDFFTMMKRNGQEEQGQDMQQILSYIIGKFTKWRTLDEKSPQNAGKANRRWLKEVNIKAFFKFIVI